MTIKMHYMLFQTKIHDKTPGLQISTSIKQWLEAFNAFRNTRPVIRNNC